MDTESDEALLALGPNEDELQLWGNYAAAKRAGYASRLQELAKRGSLPKVVLDKEFEFVKLGMRYTVSWEMGFDGRFVVKPKMEFSADPQLALEAKVALAIITLTGEGYAVLRCAHKSCGKLFIRRPSEKGPKREACELHVNAYRQARHRAAASKHK